MSEPVRSSIIGVGVCLLSFAFATLIGLALLSFAHGRAARRRRFRAPEVLLAPTLGFAALTIPSVWLNVLGLPVGSFAYPLCIAFGAIGIGRLVWSRERIDFRCFWPFLAILTAAFFLMGRPLIEFGTDWVSYGNHDMTTYSLEAQRQISHSFYQPPNASDWLRGADFPAYHLSYYAFGLTPRAGADTLLAVLSVVFAALPLRLYMPLLLALTLCLIAGVAALTYVGRTGRAKALLTALFLACSALVALGTMSQLFPQVFGLALLAAALAEAVAMLVRPSWDTAIIAALPTAALAMVYPEAGPFLIGATLLYVLIRIARRQLRATVALRWTAMAALLTVLLFAVSWRTATVTLINQIPHAANKVGATTVVQFPYFLIPIGPPILFGLMPIGAVLHGSLLNAAILVGLMLLTCLCILTAEGLWHNEACSAVSAVMLTLAVALFARKADFGLYKLAMFAAPFVAAVFASSLSRLLPRRSLGSAIIAFITIGFVGMNFIVQQIYVERSRGVAAEFPTSALAEIPNASPARMYARLDHMRAELAPGATLLSDTGSWTIAEIEGAYFQGHPLNFVSYDYVGPVASVDTVFLQSHPRLRRVVQPLEMSRRASFRERTIGTYAVGLDEPDYFKTDRRISSVLRSPKTMLLATSPEASALNRWYPDPKPAAEIEAIPLSRVRNWLVFVDSSLGQNVMFRSPDRSGLGGAQPIGGGSVETAAAAGRFILLTAIGMERPVRLEVFVSAGSIGAGRLPPALVHGATTTKLAFVGSGSARVITEALNPIYIDGWPLFLIDAGSDGYRFPEIRQGLMNLYGRDIKLNWLRIAWFVRDISLLPASAVNEIEPPSLLSDIVKDLQNRNLLFSGIYDDGWLSRESFVSLTRREADKFLIVNGLVPPIVASAFSTRLETAIDGRVIFRRTLHAGYFRLRVPIPTWATPGDHRVALRFSRTQELPKGDGRIVAALPSAIGFTP